MTKRKTLRERRAEAADAYADSICGRVKPGTAKGRQWLIVWAAHFNGSAFGYRAAKRDVKRNPFLNPKPGKDPKGFKPRECKGDPMTDRPDNPPAFQQPVVKTHQTMLGPQVTVEMAGGMSLRDYAAIKIVAGWCANSNPQCGGPYDQMADEAYRFADAMLAARGRT